MRKLRLEIVKSILKIALEIAKIIGTAVGTTLLLLLELLVHSSRYTPVGLLLFDDDDDDELMSIELYSYIGDFVDNIKDHIEDIKVLLTEMQTAKIQEKEQEKAKELQDLLAVKTFNDGIIEYIRNILLKLDQLPLEEQRFFTEKLREILADYTSKYFDALRNPNTEPLQEDKEAIVRQTTLDKLVTIDLAVCARIKVNNKISAVSVEEKEILAMMQQKTQTSPPQEGQKLAMRM